MALIDCEKIGFSYDGKSVISDLSFFVEKGDYLCIVGENGAGKSTLVKGILGLIKPSSGKISFSEGLEPKKIGYLPQKTDIQKDFPASCFEVVLSGTLNKCGFFPFYTNESRAEADRNMRLLGIENLKKRSFQELSGGQQQRVLLARALCAAEKLILLDEPAAGLDPLVTKELYELIRKLNKEYGICVIMVSHDIAGAIANAKHILHLEHDGVFFGSVNEYIKGRFGKRFFETSEDKGREKKDGAENG